MSGASCPSRSRVRFSSLSFGSGLRGQRFAPATTPSADSRGSIRSLRSARSHCWQTLGPPGIRLSASLQATPNLPRRLPSEYRASESIAPLPSQRRPCIRFLFMMSVVLPPASCPTVSYSAVAFGSWFRSFGPQGTSTPQALSHVRRTTKTPPLSWQRSRKVIAEQRLSSTGAR